MGISKALAVWFSNYDSPTSGGSKLRAKRIAPLLAMIESVFIEKGSVTIIDLGGAEQYWNIISRQYLKKYNVKITIVNLPGSITTLDHGPFTFIEADACNLNSFSDKSFDIVHSNSVIEHVGDWQRMVQFSREVSRVAENFFVQTPNYWFPLEPHCMTPFFHWLPEPLRVWLVHRFQLGHWSRAESTDEAVKIVQSARLLSKSMLHALFTDASISTERFFLLPKSFVAIKSQKMLKQNAALNS